MYAALVGSIATALLGVFTGDTGIGRALTVVAVIATTVATYQLPNRPAPRRKAEGGFLTIPRQRDDSGRIDALYVLCLVVGVLLVIVLLRDLV